MSTGTTSSQGIFGSFPYESTITPATIAGLVIAVAQYLLQIGLSANAINLEAIVMMLIGAIGTIGFVLAILAIVVSGARTDVLLVGAILTYVAELFAVLLRYIYVGLSPDISAELLLTPLSPVIIVIGIGIGVNWIGVDVSL